MKRERKAIGKTLYSWNAFDADIKKLAQKIKRLNQSFSAVWGPARGGLPIAVCLSHALDIPLAKRPADTSILIVDDIADTGRTLRIYAKKNFTIATIFYHKQCCYAPSVWLHEKGDQWIVFPWEKK